MHKYHFGGKEEAKRVTLLLDKFNNNFNLITDINQFRPHRVVLLTKIPLQPTTIFGISSKFGLLSEDGCSISYGGVMCEYGVDKNGVGFHGNIVNSNEEFEELKTKEVEIDCTHYHWD